MSPDPSLSRRRLLVVEDEADIRYILLHNLGREGFDVRGVETGQAALTEIDGFQPHLVLLDIMLPDLSGIEVCRRIRANPLDPRPAIIMLTAKAEEIDRVVGFEVGADDYVTKPFSIRELVLRVRARLQATERGTPAVGVPSGGVLQGHYKVGLIEIDAEAHRVRVAGKELQVSFLELQLLLHLAAARGAVCTRRHLLTHVWKYSSEVSSRTVDTHVKRLRDKMGPAGDLIHTIRGVGYRLSDV